MLRLSRWSTLAQWKNREEEAEQKVSAVPKLFSPFLLSPLLQSVNYYERRHDERFRAFSQSPSKLIEIFLLPRFVFNFLAFYIFFCDVKRCSFFYIKALHHTADCWTESKLS
jgi:hypothetical protein